MTRRFRLERHSDPSGQSGVGVVLEGCQWTDGTVSIRWLGVNRSWANWEDLQTFLNVHTHYGVTGEIVWLDGPDRAWRLSIAGDAGVAGVEMIFASQDDGLATLRDLLAGSGFDVDAVEPGDLLHYIEENVPWVVTLEPYKPSENDTPRRT